MTTLTLVRAYSDLTVFTCFWELRLWLDINPGSILVYG